MHPPVVLVSIYVPIHQPTDYSALVFDSLAGNMKRRDRANSVAHRHFTQLVAVGPFAVLGLVLMACTARVCKVTGITDLYEEIASEDMKSVLRLMDAGTVAEIGDLLGDDDEGEDDDEEDEGEVVAREG